MLRNNGALELDPSGGRTNLEHLEFYRGGLHFFLYRSIQ